MWEFTLSILPTIETCFGTRSSDVKKFKRRQQNPRNSKKLGKSSRHPSSPPGGKGGVSKMARVSEGENFSVFSLAAHAGYQLPANLDSGHPYLTKAALSSLSYVNKLNVAGKPRHHTTWISSWTTRNSESHELIRVISRTTVISVSISVSLLHFIYFLTVYPASVADQNHFDASKDYYYLQ